MNLIPIQEPQGNQVNIRFFTVEKLNIAENFAENEGKKSWQTMTCYYCLI